MSELFGFDNGNGVYDVVTRKATRRYRKIKEEFGGVFTHGSAVFIMFFAFFFFSLLALLPVSAAAGNQSISSFSKAKKILQQQVYADHRTTIYCNANFDSSKHVFPLAGFVATKYKKRAKRIEWEHVVPAENFGRTFTEWRDGDPGCVDRKGKSFKGRNCASKVNLEYRYMQSDMYNLYPAIGAVNASRSNYNFRMLPSSESSFGSCDMRIENRKVQPPESARGKIARTYKYMQFSYPRYKMSRQQQKLMEVWDKMYPVTKWECTRAARIEEIQGNDNPFVSDHCASNLDVYKKQ